MKRMVLIAMGLLLLAGSGYAQYPGLPDTAYVGLFADVGHTVRSVNYGGGPGPTIFTMYIYWLPSARGLQAAEFKILYPANVMGTTVTKNPYIAFEMGTLPAGITSSFSEDTCMTDWVQSHRQTCLLMSAVQSEIMVVEHPDILPFPEYHVATCEPGYPVEPVKRFTHLYMNWDGGVAVENKSWSSIKSLF